MILLSQAVTVWFKDLCKGLEQAQLPLAYIARADQMISALQFVRHFLGFRLLLVTALAVIMQRAL